MGDEKEKNITFPRDLVDWAGHHSGGVKRLFDSSSGRPGKDLLRTVLISKLENWVSQLVSGASQTPRIVLLVGGPGNGKTEAIEHTIKRLDESLSAQGKLVEELAIKFRPSLGKVPRLVEIKAGQFASPPRQLDLAVVQDASVTAGHEGTTAPVLLIDELLRQLSAPESQIYLCCVNRGVLDDALIHAIEGQLDRARELLEAITRGVSLAYNSPSCWPLEGFPSIAIWPMDAESLFTSPDANSISPAAQLVDHVLKDEYWPEEASCAAKERCPYCHSHSLLRAGENREALLRMLRWYELASGKRWNFRDLFSLLSFLLSGNEGSEYGEKKDPCDWAANLIKLDQESWVKPHPSTKELTAVLHLATSSYQHLLFHCWDKSAVASLRRDVKALGLGRENDFRIIHGLLAFLLERKTSHLPATIAALIEDLAETLDPALASPEVEIVVDSNRVLLADLDVRFSRSLVGGLEFVNKCDFLSLNELELLKRLAIAENSLSSPLIRKRNPAAATRIQRTLRDFACRLVRRSLCARFAVVANASVLNEFQQVVEDEQGRNLHEVAQQIKRLLNSSSGFEVSLTTTFGQPLPPKQRQAILVAPSQPVKSLPQSTKGRPKSPICFLGVGQGGAMPIALTYDLFLAIRELQRGLSQASLPKTVVALLDTTRAKLSGSLVRDADVLEDLKINIGLDGVEISKSWSGFVASRKDKSYDT